MNLCMCKRFYIIQWIVKTDSIILTGSRVSNEPIMNPGGQRGSKNLVNLIRIGQWIKIFIVVAFKV